MVNPDVQTVYDTFPEAKWFEDQFGWTIYNGDEALGKARKLQKAWKKAAVAVERINKARLKTPRRKRK